MVQYRYYEDKDAEQVMELFRRNRFYLGKRPANAEDFRYAWRARGGLFGIVGETETGEIIAFLAAYPTGDRIVCYPHQILLGSMLVDEKYQRSLYSLPEMYHMMILTIFDHPEYTTIISEVDDFRRQSLLIQRYSGAVMLNGAVPVADGVYDFYNFLPGIRRFFDPSSASMKTKMMKALRSVDKSRAEQPDPVRLGQFVDCAYHLSYGRTRFSVHIPSGLVTQMETPEWALGIEDGLDTLYLRFAKKDGRALVRLYGKDGQMQEETWTVGAGETFRKALPEGTEKVFFALEGAEDSFWLELGRIRQSMPVSPAPIKLGFAELDPETGILMVPGKMAEIWPFMHFPYLIGALRGMTQPNLTISEHPGSSRGCDSPDRQLTEAPPHSTSPDVAQTEEEHCLTAIVNTASGTLRRTYSAKGDTIRIHTWYKGMTSDSPEPLFQVNLLDRSAVCTFVAENGEETEIAIDYARDLKTASPEIPYVLLGEEKEKAILSREMILRFKEETYRIQFEQPVTAFLQFEYLEIRPVVTKSETGSYDFPEWTITRI